ncbi:MAG: hypothetical protein A2Y50_15595 [Pseudomonadales bacterium RIFCSPLOWO2_12_59_9]|jgi:hypothetical protein|nr:MAG: hypothetical protein A2Y50_15595 [Pseudomonadales bacterium RIFCSPLOWO2_12_59_9]
MEQSGIVGFDTLGNPERITNYRDAPFCSTQAFVDMMASELITPDVVRGWVENQAIPTVKIGRRRVINLHRIRRDIDQGKTIFCSGDYSDD